MRIDKITNEYGFGTVTFSTPKEQISVAGHITVIEPVIYIEAEAILPKEPRIIEIDLCAISEQEALVLLQEKEPIKVYCELVKDMDHVLLRQIERNENNVISLDGYII